MSQKQHNSSINRYGNGRIVRLDLPGDIPSLPPGMPQILQRIYTLRGIRDATELERGLDKLIPASEMSGLDQAVEILAGALELDARILIVGDFDADGATSCALAMLAFRSLGHHNIDYLVPNRFEYGYGLTPKIVELARQRNPDRKPDLIVTVDNGISSIAGVEAANTDMQVIVTDHHLPGAQLPDAAAIVNPSLPDNTFPSTATAGVGVIFYVLLGLRARLRELDWFERKTLSEPNMGQFLDLVALGTVADVVPLDRNNRILVHHGLNRIRAGQCRPGITALLQVAGRNPHRVQASDMGFAVGPRLNAAGRLDDMGLGIECLLAESPDQARDLAHELDRLNRERRTIEDGMKQQAEAMLADWAPDDNENLPWGLSLFREDWHQGVIGILASRIKERYQRPVIAFAPGDDGEIKGSARSIPGLHIRDALDKIAARHPDMLKKFGGHAMAAGMTLKQESFAEFSQVFDQVVREHITDDDLYQVVHSDGAVPAEEITLETANALLEGGPWGQAFPEPLFDDVFRVTAKRIVGEKHWKLVLCHHSGTPTIDAIAFNTVEDYPDLPECLHAAYRLDVNEWRGRVTPQLRIEYLEPVYD